MEKIERIKTYIQGFDEHIEGGIPKGSISLICGTPGTMKSSLAYSMLYNNAVKDNLKGIYITLEQGVRSLRQQMNKLGMGEHRNIVMADFDSFVKKPDEKNFIKSASAAIAKKLKEGKYDLLAFDSINALYSLTEIENPRHEIYYFFKTLMDADVTSLLISEMPLDRSRFSEYGIEEFLADSIIHMDMKERVDVLSALERYIGIVKMRKTNHDTQYLPLIYIEDKFRAYSREDLELE